MQCSTPTFNLDIFTDNYFTSFGLLSHVGVSDIQPKGVLNKNRLRKCTTLGKNSCKKRNAVILNSAAQIKQTSSVTCVVGENDSRVVCIASSESCQSIRDLFGAGTKLKESALKNNNQVNSTVTTRT